MQLKNIILVRQFCSIIRINTKDIYEVLIKMIHIAQFNEVIFKASVQFLILGVTVNY